MTADNPINGLVYIYPVNLSGQVPGQSTDVVMRTALANLALYPDAIVNFLAFDQTSEGEQTKGNRVVMLNADTLKELLRRSGHSLGDIPQLNPISRMGEPIHAGTEPGPLPDPRKK